MADKSSLRQILQRPLVVGASVSADHLTFSPGKRLALNFTELRNITVLAGNGRRGRDLNFRVLEQAINRCSVLIGIDTFFWDSLAPTPEPSLCAMDKLIELARAQQIPVVLGEIPSFLPQMQKSLEPLNAHLKQAAKLYSRLHVLSLNHILEQIARDGHFAHDGQQLDLLTLLPDGLHIGEPASEYLAGQIATLLLREA